MKKYKIGFTTGVFDLLHVGHLNLLEKCKEMCNYLIVGVCNDDYVKNIKNKEPIFTQEDRLRIIKSLKCVDDAVLMNIGEIENKLIFYKNRKFDVLFSGDDWKGSERYKKTEEEFKNYGISIEYLPYTKGISTTDIKGKIYETKTTNK